MTECHRVINLPDPSTFDNDEMEDKFKSSDDSVVAPIASSIHIDHAPSGTHFHIGRLDHHCDIYMSADGYDKSCPLALSCWVALAQQSARFSKDFIQSLSATDLTFA